RGGRTWPIVFPYASCFRSLAHQGLLGGHQVAFLPAPGGDLADQVILDLLENGGARLRARFVQTALRKAIMMTIECADSIANSKADRKSTRLNSSHVKISYA